MANYLAPLTAALARFISSFDIAPVIREKRIYKSTQIKISIPVVILPRPINPKTVSNGGAQKIKRQRSVEVIILNVGFTIHFIIFDFTPVLFSKRIILSDTLKISVINIIAT